MGSIRNLQGSVTTILTQSFFVFFLALSFANAALESQLPSTVPGLTIRNAHMIYQTPMAKVYRGQAPKQNEIPQLLSLGVQRFLIFKNDSRGEVAREIAFLHSKGVLTQNILHLEMPWKDSEGFQNTCMMTVEALKFIETSVEKNMNVFFHCTMGEDRTGYLAGLWGLWVGTYSTPAAAFKQEMCARGYEGGNPNKPYIIARDVREALTPNWLKMVQLLKQARLTGKSLSQISCPRDIVLHTTLTGWTCR